MMVSTMKKIPEFEKEDLFCGLKLDSKYPGGYQLDGIKVLIGFYRKHKMKYSLELSEAWEKFITSEDGKRVLHQAVKALKETQVQSS